MVSYDIQGLLSIIATTTPTFKSSSDITTSTHDTINKIF
jgi:hypothetical protein